MSEHNDSIFRNIYRVRAEAVDAVEVVPGAESPVAISILLRDHASLQRAVVDAPVGGIVKIDVRKDAVLEIYAGIAALAKAQGWRLPDA
jgi:metal-dependent HD superfamily phosphatase/phosphodiesterase